MPVETDVAVIQKELEAIRETLSKMPEVGVWQVIMDRNEREARRVMESLDRLEDKLDTLTITLTDAGITKAEATEHRKAMEWVYIQKARCDNVINKALVWIVLSAFAAMTALMSTGIVEKIKGG